MVSAATALRSARTAPLPRRVALWWLAGLVFCAAAQADLLQPEAASGVAPKPALRAQRHIAVTAHPLASAAASEVLEQGGSAVDAAIAAQLVLNLVEPQSSGLGGGGFMLVWDAQRRRVRAYDGRETAPAAARPDRFLDDAGKPLPFHSAAVSGRSVGVPGLPALLALVHARHGRLPWARLMEPARKLAEDGFAVSPRLHQLLAQDKFLRNDPSARALYYEADGNAKPVGAWLRNPAFAASLQTLASGGAGAFNEGPLADEIVAAAGREGSDLTAQDLRSGRSSSAASA